MKRLLQLLIPIMLQACFCPAQTFDWAKQFGGTHRSGVFGGTANDYVSAITTDVMGNVLATGSFLDTADFDPGAGVHKLWAIGGPDAFVVKLDANGNFKWAKDFGSDSLGDIGRKIRTDAAGNVYVMGTFWGTVDFDPGPGAFNMTTYHPEGEELFVVKLDSAGNFVWAIQRKPLVMGNLAHICDLRLGTGGNIYMSYGFDFNNGNIDQVVIEKTNNTGTLIWQKTINTITNFTIYPFLADQTMVLDDSDNIYLAGTFLGEVDFDPNGTHIVKSTGQDGYVLKLTNNGSFVWVKKIEQLYVGSMNVLDITLDPGGNICLAGRYAGGVDFDPDTSTYIKTTGSTSPGSGMFQLKLTGAGKFLWAKTYCTTHYYDYNELLGITTDDSGAVYTTGRYRSFCVFNGSSVPGTGLSHDALILKLSDTGSFQWMYQVAGLGNGEIGYAITANHQGNLYTAGVFDSTTNFNFPGSGYNMTSVGDRDVFIQKLTVCSGSVDTSVTQADSLLTATAAGAAYRWIDCNTNNYITGATSQTFIPPVTGSYAAIVLQNGCWKMSGCRSVKISTAVASVPKAAAAIYPNPTDGVVAIKLDKQYEQVNVTITSTIGTVISKTDHHNTTSINTRIDGASGIYFICITADGEIVARQRLVKAN